MKKFKFTFRKVLYILFIIIFVCTIPTFVIGVLKLAGVLSSINLFLDVAATALALAIAILEISLVFFSNYVFYEDKLALYFGFFRQYITYENISTVRKLSDDSLWLIYTDSKNRQAYMMLNIKKDDYDEFIGEIKLHDPNILYIVGQGDNPED